jgi:hypothetical protein
VPTSSKNNAVSERKSLEIFCHPATRLSQANMPRITKRLPGVIKAQTIFEVKKKTLPMG